MVVSFADACGSRQSRSEALERSAEALKPMVEAGIEEGTINFPAFLGALKDAGYEGWLAAEHIRQSYMNTLFEDVISETVKMRDCFRRWLD